MQLTQISRVPVVDEKGTLVGIVTRLDILGAVVGSPKAPRGSLQPAQHLGKGKRPVISVGSDPRAKKSAEQWVYGDVYERVA